MKASYGYEDGSGEFFVTIDTDRCDGCGACVRDCPAGIFMVGRDEADPFAENFVATVREERRKKLEHECGPCKSMKDGHLLPCLVACRAGAIRHTW